MRAFQCDRCKQYYNDSYQGYNGLHLIQYGMDAVTYDLCPNCMKLILDVLKDSKEDNQ